VQQVIKAVTLQSKDTQAAQVLIAQAAAVVVADPAPLDLLDQE
jgi:hypothetical protein